MKLGKAGEGPAQSGTARSRRRTMDGDRGLAMRARARRRDGAKGQRSENEGRNYQA